MSNDPVRNDPIPPADMPVPAGGSVPILDHHQLTNIQFYGWDREAYDPEFYDLVRKETVFLRDEMPQLLERTVSRRVGLGEMACPNCGWQLDTTPGIRMVPVCHIGKDTHLELKLLKRCVCHYSELLWQRWAGKKAMIDSRLRDCSLYALVNNPPRIKCSTTPEFQSWMIRSLVELSSFFGERAGQASILRILDSRSAADMPVEITGGGDDPSPGTVATATNTILNFFDAPKHNGEFSWVIDPVRDFNRRTYLSKGSDPSAGKTQERSNDSAASTIQAEQPSSTDHSSTAPTETREETKKHKPGKAPGTVKAITP